MNQSLSYFRHTADPNLVISKKNPRLFLVLFSVSRRDGCNPERRQHHAATIATERRRPEGATNEVCEQRFASALTVSFCEISGFGYTSIFSRLSVSCVFSLALPFHFGGGIQAVYPI